MATLELRLTNLAQAVGADIKALTAAIAGLSAGGATIKSAVINAPYGTVGAYSEVISDATLTANSKVIVQFGAVGENDENDEEDIAELTVLATPIASGLRVTVNGAWLFGGPIPINYMIGA